jgi:hypothetical protein
MTPGIRPSHTGVGRVSSIGAENPRPNGGIAPQSRGSGGARQENQ